MVRILIAECLLIDDTMIVYLFFHSFQISNILYLFQILSGGRWRKGHPDAEQGQETESRAEH